jgi:hypothetical protein
VSDWPRLLRSDALGAAALACRILGDLDDELDAVTAAEHAFIARSLTYLWTQVLDDRQRDDIRETLDDAGLDLDDTLAAAGARAWLGYEAGGIDGAGWDGLLGYLADDARKRGHGGESAGPSRVTEPER